MKTDLVPCFYTGQNPLRDKPAELAPRAIVRDYKKKGFGKFVASGQFFMFFARMTRVAETAMRDFRASARTILTFIKTGTQGDRLHYEIPMAGDVGMRRYGLFRRRDEDGVLQLESHVIPVSGRNLFAVQQIG